MIRRLLGALGAVLVGLFAIVPSAAADQAGAGREGHVLIITAPRLTWERLQSVRPPNIMALLRRSAVGLASPRTAGGSTRPGDAYLTIGAGNRMSAFTDDDGVVVARTERVPEGDPAEVYLRNTGERPRADILALAKPVIDKANATEYHFGAEAGSLGSALERAHRSIAVLANADRQLGEPSDRQAALAAMDVDGQIRSGIVSDELLRGNAESAFGVEIDAAVHAQAFAHMWEESDVVVAELSDLERAEAARSDATTEQGDRQFRRALRHSDELVGEMMRRVDLDRDTVILVGPTAPAEQNQLTVFAMAGPGVAKGWASSSTTRRDGYVTLTDIAPTTLDRLGIDVPDEMSDTRLTSAPSDRSLGERIGWMIDESDRAVARDSAFGPITVVFVVAVVVDIALGMLCLARVEGLAGVVRGLALVVLAVPPVTFLLGLVTIRSAGVLGAAVGVGAVVVAALVWLTRRVDPRVPPIVLFGLLWLVLAVDVVTGGKLQINTVFGYSPIVAGRFAGFGNQAFSMIALSALLLAAEYVDRRSGPAPDGAPIRRGALALVVAAWFLVTVVLDGHPSFGADVGGVLAFVPAAMVALLLFVGIKVRFRLMALIAAGTVGLLAIFAAIDVSRPEEDRTHLGRFVAKLFDGQAGEIIQRKIAANVRVLTSVWAWVIPVALVYFVYLTWRPNRTLQHLNADHHQFRAFGISALVLGVLAMAVNDSGVSMPAMMVALAAAYVSYLVIELERTP